MQLTEFQVDGLFGRYDHVVRFPHAGEASDVPSVVVLHGPNGVGKTTILRMLDGIMHLDYDMFRITPFGRARITFTKENDLTVTRIGPDGPLNIAFGNHEVLLHPRDKGAYQPSHEEAVERFRNDFTEAVKSISFELIETQRALRRSEGSHEETEGRYRDPARVPGPRERLRLGLRAGQADRELSLAERVKRFIAEAQVDAARFFRGRDPSLFDRIFGALQKDELPEYSPDTLLKTLRRIKREDAISARLGLTPDPWNQSQLIGFLKDLDDSPRGRQALLVLGAYVESLEARADLRRLVVDRLLRFEHIMADFLMDKSVATGRIDGLRIEAADGTPLGERQLSSGEFHLLYLMVSALVAKRRGTVIAIDEPEMSMHIAWQRKLIRNLIECASNAVPQFVFATHSPDIVAEWREYMVRLGPSDDL